MQRFFSTVVVQRDQKVLFVVLVLFVGFYTRTHTTCIFFQLGMQFLFGKVISLLFVKWLNSSGKALEHTFSSFALLFSAG